MKLICQRSRRDFSHFYKHLSIIAATASIPLKLGHPCGLHLTHTHTKYHNTVPHSPHFGADLKNTDLICTRCREAAIPVRTAGIPICDTRSVMQNGLSTVPWHTHTRTENKPPKANAPHGDGSLRSGTWGHEKAYEPTNAVKTQKRGKKQPFPVTANYPANIINAIPGAEGLPPQMNYVHMANLEAEESHVSQRCVPPPEEGEK